MSGSPRRFIAGAVCPRCGAQDRIRVYEEDGRRLRDCVACDFSDVLEEGTTGEVPGGRLDAARKPPEDGARPLRFHPPRRRRDQG